MKTSQLSFLVSLVLSVAGAARADEFFISADEAKGLLGKPSVQFVSADAEKDYEKAHIPGSASAYAHDMQYLDDVRACKGLPMCEPTAQKAIGALGIDNATQVIVYDSGMGVNASGDWFFLTLYGHKNVKILDGGLATWKAHGGAVEMGKPKAIAPKAFKTDVQWAMIANLDEVKKASTTDAAKYLIVDARHNLDEYTGKSLLSGLQAPGKEVTAKKGGFIPTAVFSPWSKYAGNKNAEADKPTLKNAADLNKQLEKLKKSGYDASKTVISYCHVGLGRGSFQYLALQKAGHKNTKLYVGSWNEYGNTDGLPVGTPDAAAAQ